MTTKIEPRELSETPFICDLEEGLLNSLLKRVQSDTAMDMEIRNDYVNIYYRGGNILRVKNIGDGYKVFFDEEYSTAPLNLPECRITTERELQAWLDRIPVLKDTMDLSFGLLSKGERAAQQLVVHENNVGPWASGTDYFIVDIEYDNHVDARFDLVALRWDSDPVIRKLQKKYKPTLTAIEMKIGDGALTGKSGVFKHYQQWVNFFSDVEKVQAFKSEMLKVFKQKRRLGLIPALKDNHHAVEEVANDIDVVFLFANHDPASGKLAAEVEKIFAHTKSTSAPFNLRFATATFMGLGLYSQNLLTLAEFRQQLERIGTK